MNDLTRRGFLGAILAAAAAPAIVRAESIMRVAPPAGWRLGAGGVLTLEMIDRTFATLRLNDMLTVVSADFGVDDTMSIAVGYYDGGQWRCPPDLYRFGKPIMPGCQPPGWCRET